MSKCAHVSNETPWGVAEHLRLARYHGAPRIQSIQNAYSLLNRIHEIGLAEMSIRERCGLLADTCGSCSAADTDRIGPTGRGPPPRCRPPAALTRPVPTSAALPPCCRADQARSTIGSDLS